MIELNETFLIQLVNFFIMIFFLNHFLFKPVMENFEKRNKRISSFGADVAKFTDKSEKAIAEYEKKLVVMRKETGEILSSAKEEAIAEQTRLIQEARDGFAGQIESAKKEIASQVELASASLKKDADAISKDISSKLLGRSV